MAEVLASLKKIGGNGEQYTETVLWTNPSPTADFAAQTVTLSNSIDNYKYIKIKYCFSKSYNTGNYLSDYIISVDEFKKAPYPEASGTARLNFSFARMNTSNVAGYRRFYYASSTTIRFGSTDTNALIPLEILGINELAHGKIAPNETIFLGNFASTSMSLTTFTLLDDLSNYRYLIMANSQKDANGNMISDRSAVDAILSIEQLKNDGSITYHSALSNGSAFNVTIGYVDDTHITEQRTGSANKEFWIYAV